MKEKIDVEFYQDFLNVCSVKDSIERMKRFTDRKKTVPKHLSDKGRAFKIQRTPKIQQ